MEKHIVEEIIACLPEGRTPFHYFKDRYALLLLSFVVGDGMKVADLKRTSYAGLLDKPLIKHCLAGIGNGVVTAEILNACWPVPIEPFLLSLSIWGEGKRDRTWHQISRHGYNLVLQLNFSQKHDRQYRRLIKPMRDDVFYFDLHPVMQPGRRQLFRETLAWARIDLDFQRDEALIEEVQSDWVGYARYALEKVLEGRKRGEEEVWLYGIAGSNENVIRYIQEVLGPYARIWEEAMLAAAIVFIRAELGIRNIYYHSFETGATVKGITDSKPPRSLYTSLPRRFCFCKTQTPPVFLGNNKMVRKALKKVATPYWFQLRL